MKKPVLVFFFFVFSLVSEHAYCEDNLLAIDSINLKEETATQGHKVIPKEEIVNESTQLPLPEPEEDDDLDKDLKKIKAHREFMVNKQKELEIIKLDLEKSDLLLKKKEAEKKIYEIDKSLPQGKKEDMHEGSPFHNGGHAFIDSSDIKILLILISDDLKEGIMTLRGAPYSFREGDCVASKLTVDSIEPDSVTFRQPDEAVLKLNFTN